MNKIISVTILLIFTLIFFVNSNKKQISIPLPKADIAIDLPAKNYEKVKISNLYSIDIPSYCNIDIKDHDVSLSFPFYQAEINLDLILLDKQDQFFNQLEGLRNYIRDYMLKISNEDSYSYIENDSLVGFFWTFRGPVPKSVIFYYSDQKSFFIYGELSFIQNNVEDVPVYILQFLQDDVQHLHQSFNWLEEF